VFRNKIFPDEFNAAMISRVVGYEIDMYSGSSVVFSNVLPHKCKDLVNTTDKTLSRTILSFLIVDPSKPIYSNTGKIEHWKLLKEKKVKNIIIGHILKFLYLSQNPLEVAREKRKLVREAMKTEKSGYGKVLGDEDDINLEFFDAFHEFNNPSKYEDDLYD